MTAASLPNPKVIFDVQGIFDVRTLVATGKAADLGGNGLRREAAVTGRAADLGGDGEWRLQLRGGRRALAAAESCGDGEGGGPLLRQGGSGRGGDGERRRRARGGRRWGGLLTLVTTESCSDG